MKIKKILKKTPQTCSRLQILFLTIGRESTYQQGRTRKKTSEVVPTKIKKNNKIKDMKNIRGIAAERNNV